MSTVLIVFAVIAVVLIAGWVLYSIVRHRHRSTAMGPPRAGVPGYMPHTASSEYYRPGDRQQPAAPPAPQVESPAEVPRDPRKAPLPRCPMCDAAVAYDQERCPRCGHVLRPF